MSAHEMVCHLVDSCRMMTGERAVSPATGPLQRTVVKWIALYAPLQWPPAKIRTRPEVDPLRGGTRPADFATDVAALEALLAGLTTRGGGWPSHPIFGRMSERDWFRWAYLHTDHHFRQFGV
jgi:hypothetical protein